MKRTLPMFLSLAALPALAQSPALAQTFVPVPVTVVTATRLEDPVDRVPAAVTVITEEEMEERGYLSFEEALRGTPGLSVTRSGGLGQPTSVFMRGTNSNQTLVLFDGVPINDPSAPTGAFDFSQDGLGGIGQIEIVRGPGSALYGSNAIGGVINLIPSVGADGPLAPFGEVAIGTEGLFMGTVGLRGSLDRVDYGFAIEGMRTDGHNVTPADDPSNIGERDGFDSIAFTGRFEAELTDQSRVDGVFRFRDSTSELDAWEDSPYDKTLNQHALWRLGGEIDLLDGALTPRLDVGQSFYDREAITPNPAHYDGRLSFANAQLTARLGDFGVLDEVTLLGGVQFHNERMEERSATPVAESHDSIAAFIQAQALAFDRVDLSAQLRRENPGNYDGETTWRLGGNVDLPELNGRIFGSLGKAFRAPTLNEQYGFWGGNPDLHAETSFSAEIGGEIDITAHDQGDYVTIGLAWFHSEIDDLIVSGPAPDYQLGNIESAGIHGIEAYADWRPLNWAEARLAYTWTDARNNQTGARLQRRPEHMITLSANLEPLAGLTLAPEIQFTGEQEDWGGRIDPLTLVNVSATYAVNNQVELFGRVTNLLDEDYENPLGFAGSSLNGLVGIRAQL